MRALLFILAATACAQSQDIPVPGASIPWASSYREARTLSKARNLPIIIEIGGKDCLYCKKMNTETLTQTEIAKLLRSAFVPLKLDAARDRELVAGLGVRLLPTYIIANPDGKVIASVEGFSQVESFQKFLTEGISQAVGTPDIGGMLADASKAAEAGEAKKAMEILERILAMNPEPLMGKKAAALLAELQGGKPAVPTQPAVPETQPKSVGAFGSLASRSTVKEAGESILAEGLIAKMQENKKSGRVALAHGLAEQIKALAPGTSAEADAQRVIDDIIKDPGALKQLVEAQTERLAAVLFQAAESSLGMGQPQQAIYYLERVAHAFPNSRFSSLAQTRLAQILGAPRKAVVDQEPR